MRAAKDRLHRVLVIGATPAGIAATNKLGEMGIPVTLVDSDPDLDQKLAAEQWRLASGLSFNHAQRPGLLRILRNPKIRCILPGEVTALKHTAQGFSAQLKRFPAFIDPNRCTLCGECAKTCPGDACGDAGKPLRFAGRRSLPGRPVIDKRRRPLCQTNCPLGVNAQGYMALTKAGRFAEALELVRRDNVLPGICGRVCTHPCESACRRAELDDPLAIRDIKRFLADYELSHPAAAGRKGMATAPALEPVAVIGSGPAGLAAAADLARLGYRITVFEREAMAGGLLRYGIGPHRLPRDVLDREIEHIENLGVEFKTSHPLDLPGDLAPLRKEFSSVVIATGSWMDRALGVPGEDLEGVVGCLEFLGDYYRGRIGKLQENVAVIGDGNAAFDLARTLVRIGAKVSIVSWFPRDLIPADHDEVAKALEESISIIDRTQVIGFTGKDGKFEGLRCAAAEPGEPDANGVPWPVIVAGKAPFDLEFDRAFVAIGQMRDERWYDTDRNQPVAPRTVVLEDGSSVDSIYVAGDAARGPASVVLAMASGRNAARAVHREISGEDLAAGRPQRPEERDFVAITPDIPSVARAQMPEKQAAARKDGFAEVALGLSEVQALSEAARCLQCGGCSECLRCVEVCKSSGAILHDEEAIETIEQAGVVIIADPALAPSVKGEDVIRAYSTKNAAGDVYGMMVRGFGAAAEAMNLLGGSSERLMGRGVAFTPPDPLLSPDLRIGVFVCRCNDSLGWPEALNGAIGNLAGRANVEWAEAIPSACASEGSAAILRAIREKGLTRVVLASCVCCPLDFVCTACTDQRSRLKDSLFKGTGISRAMIETCNLRGEVLRLVKDNEPLALARFAGLLDRSIGRVGNVKTMPAPARPYNFTTAVIGDSEAALKSALMLAEAGMEVFLFGTLDRPLSKSPAHANIHGFDGSMVRGICGTLGNFQVLVDLNGSPQVLHAGAVILGEQSRKRVPYMPQAGLAPRMVESGMQKRGETGIPFFSPGATSIPGLFLANPPWINVSERIKGASAAILAASVMPRRPRQNKGYTVAVDKNRCRGCGRCMEVCPYQAVSFRDNGMGGWHSVVDEALCKGCGNCIPVCPSNAADSPYRDRLYLEQMIDEILL